MVLSEGSINCDAVHWELNDEENRYLVFVDDDVLSLQRRSFG